MQVLPSKIHILLGNILQLPFFFGSKSLKNNSYGYESKPTPGTLKSLVYMDVSSPKYGSHMDSYVNGCEILSTSWRSGIPMKQYQLVDL